MNTQASSAAPRSRRRLFAVLLTAALLTANSQVATSTDATDSSASDDVLHFRTEFGLSTEPSMLADAIVDPSYPVPMTAEEQRDWDRRMEIEQGMELLLQYGAAQPAEFGGLWLDQAAGGVIRIGFTSRLDLHRPAILALAPTGATIEVAQVRNSWRSLEDLQTVIDNDTAFQDQIGGRIEITMASVRDNAVLIGVSDLTKDVADALERRYGHDQVVVFAAGPGQDTTCTSRSNCPGPPMRGGISGSFACSLAYYVIQDSDPRLLTAGHCAGLSSSWYHGTLYLGTMVSRAWYWDSTADAATIAGTNTRNRKSNWVYSDGAQYSLMTGTQSSSSDYEGQSVCLSGRMADAVRCGQIRNRSATVTISGMRLRYQRVGSYAYQSGDSGGAVYNIGRTIAFGVQSGCLDVTGDNVCDPYWPTYSHIGHVRNELGGPSYIYVYTGG